jgi:GNAT superfamily N-acetyltransferase
MQIVAKEHQPYSANADFGFVFNTWPKGFYYSGLNVEHEPKKEWFKKYFDYVKRKLESSTVFVACTEDDPRTFYGYAVIHGTTLEWIYVKSMFRKQGIATLLIKGKKIDSYNNMTKIGHAILNQKENQENGRNQSNRQENEGISGSQTGG